MVPYEPDINWFIGFTLAAVGIFVGTLYHYSTRWGKFGQNANFFLLKMAIFSMFGVTLLLILDLFVLKEDWILNLACYIFFLLIIVYLYAFYEAIVFDQEYLAALNSGQIK